MQIKINKFLSKNNLRQCPSNFGSPMPPGLKNALSKKPGKYDKITAKLTEKAKNLAKWTIKPKNLPDLPNCLKPQ